jgi:peptidylamidoglycolate lyase
MKTVAIFLIAVVILLISCRNQHSDTNSSNNELENISEYTLDTSWPELADNFQLGTPTGIDLDSQGNIVVFHSGPSRTEWITPFPDDYIVEETILMLDKDHGRILATWGAKHFIMPHGCNPSKPTRPNPL